MNRGNAYLTQYTHKWVVTDSLELESQKEPAQINFTPASPGTYRVTADIKDSQGKAHRSKIYQWVAGKGRVLWEQRNDDSLELIAEKSKWNVGERARYMVKNPFPGARALITIERYGVIKSWFQQFDTGTPIIEFDIEPDYLPGYYLSVVVFSPRVDKPLGEGQVDLGKPAMRIGYIKADVIDRYKTLDVTVQPQNETYKPRDKVSVELKATARHGDNHEPIELAVAVLDEAVLDLLARGTDTFDPYNGLYTVDGLDLQHVGKLGRHDPSMTSRRRPLDTHQGN